MNTSKVLSQRILMVTLLVMQQYIRLQKSEPWNVGILKLPLAMSLHAYLVVCSVEVCGSNISSFYIEIQFSLQKTRTKALVCRILYILNSLNLPTCSY